MRRKRRPRRTSGAEDGGRAANAHRPLRGGKEARCAQIHQLGREAAALPHAVRELRRGLILFLMSSLPDSDPASFLLLLLWRGLRGACHLPQRPRQGRGGGGARARGRAGRNGGGGGSGEEGGGRGAPRCRLSRRSSRGRLPSSLF
jgi:hypothetical protein